MDHYAGVYFVVQYRVDYRVERELDELNARAEHEREAAACCRVAADGDAFSGELRRGLVFLRNDSRAEISPDAVPDAEHPVFIRNERVENGGDRDDVEAPFERVAVEVYDVIFVKRRLVTRGAGGYAAFLPGVVIEHVVTVRRVCNRQLFHPNPLSRLFQKL